MKKLLFLLLCVTTFSNAQSKYTDAEIQAVAGTPWEDLIIGRDLSDFKVQVLLNKMGFYPVIENRKEDTIEDQKMKWVHSNQTNGEIVVWEHIKYNVVEKNGTTYSYTTSLDLYGDKESIIKFYINFWSKALNFRDTKPGETVNVRFLSDVATLTVNKDNTAIIKVRAAKDYYKD